MRIPLKDDVFRDTLFGRWISEMLKFFVTNNACAVVPVQVPQKKKEGKVVGESVLSPTGATSTCLLADKCW